MKLLEALIGIFELPEDDALPDGEHFIEVDDTGEIWKWARDVIKVTKFMSCLWTTHRHHLYWVSVSPSDQYYHFKAILELILKFRCLLFVKFHTDFLKYFQTDTKYLIYWPALVITLSESKNWEISFVLWPINSRLFFTLDVEIKKWLEMSFWIVTHCCPLMDSVDSEQR